MESRHLARLLVACKVQFSGRSRLPGFSLSCNCIVVIMPARKPATDIRLSGVINVRGSTSFKVRAIASRAARACLEDNLRQSRFFWHSRWSTSKSGAAQP